jgi:transcriptional regulator with XRE-family HTH domain
MNLSKVNMKLSQVNMNKNYTQIIKAYIVLNNFTQFEVADKIKMDRSLFNLKLNRQRKKKFTIDEILDIASVLNVTPDQIFLDYNIA